MKKKTILILTCILLLAGIGFTYSYLTKSLSDTNQFTTGYCDIQVNETGEIPDEVPLLEESTIEDTITVTNTGTYPCFVRAVIDFDSYLSEAASTISGTDSKWIHSDADGFYYYSEALEPASTTSALMTGIDKEPIDSYLASPYKVGITFEAIDAVNETDYESAWENYLAGGSK